MGRVFISYAREDFDIAERLYRDLKDAGANPWMDVKNLVAGKRWKSAIQREIRESSHIIVLLSSRALSKRGFVQKEINQALEVWDSQFVLRLGLGNCRERNTTGDRVKPEQPGCSPFILLVFISLGSKLGRLSRNQKGSRT